MSNTTPPTNKKILKNNPAPKDRSNFGPISIPDSKDSLVTINSDGKAVTTSLKVAEHYEKQHKNILRDIEGMLEKDAMKGRLNFEPSNYLNKQGKIQPLYIMDRTGFTLLAMGFSGDKAFDFKVQYIDAFDAMEAELMRQQEEKDKLNSPERIAKAFYDAGVFLDLEHNTMRRIVIDGIMNLFGVDISDKVPPPEQPKLYLTDPINQQLRRIREEKKIPQHHVSLKVFGSYGKYGYMERGSKPFTEKQVDQILDALGSNRTELNKFVNTEDMLIPGKVFVCIPGFRTYLELVCEALKVGEDCVRAMGRRMGSIVFNVCLRQKRN